MLRASYLFIFWYTLYSVERYKICTDIFGTIYPNIVGHLPLCLVRLHFHETNVYHTIVQV